ncbi:hypothetical protein F4779DRAFT_635566 [Xylariaceae sp. FL0662B]|nr:hypothetical protein F4779DRAFT_635566 [Xylariaceae sp. FL0662B]
MHVISKEPIAVVGSACRFAGGVSSPSQLWELLRQPRDVRSEIPTSRFQVDGFYHPDGQYHGHTNVKYGYFLEEHPGVFDAQFFGVKPVEAKALDPQQRLLLETVYESLESAGIPIERLRKSNTGVYVGLMSNDYETLMLRDIETLANYHAVGTQRGILANRISYFYDWHGPSMVVDTACSSSLVAIHLAAQALRAGEASTALACGSNLLLGPENFITYSKMNMLSPEGKSKMWSNDADGYARGEGLAAIVLKTLSVALRDGDHIECIIRETGTNQDGTTPGITMPNVDSQEALIRETYQRSHLDPKSAEDRCQYFEAHGTGTPVGDPIEAAAIHRAFWGNCSTTDTLYVGSIKTIIGHTEGTAGIAAILKASLAIQNGLIPPNLSFHELNHSVLPFYKHLRIPAFKAREWPTLPGNQPRRASVNSFGFGGTNAHVILEGFGQTKCYVPFADSPVFTPIVFSAYSEKSLVKSLVAYSKYLGHHRSTQIRDLAGTLRQRRSLLPVRLAIPGVESVTELQGRIDEVLRLAQAGDAAPGLTKPWISSAVATTCSTNKKILGVFTGQGAQYARMGAELLDKSSFARELIVVLEGHLASLPEEDKPAWSLKSELLAGSSASRLQEAAISQPLCTAIQILLVELLRQAGITFNGVIGHSSGEIGAAYAAGYLTQQDAMRIAYYRGIHSSPPDTVKGAMLVIQASSEEAAGLCSQEHVTGKVSVAAYNSSSSVTLSGDEDAIVAIEAMLEKEGKFRRRLRVDRAYHSHHMAPCSGPYLKSLKSCNIKVQDPFPDCPWYSSTHEELFHLESEIAGSYWVANMVQPVLFMQAMEKAVSHGNFDVVIEIGPHPALKGPATQTIQEVKGIPTPYRGTLSRGTCAVKTMSDALGFLWSHLGEKVDLNKYEEVVSGNPSFNLIKGLPTYQWDHDTIYWHESRASRSLRLRSRPVHPLLGSQATESTSPLQLSWKNTLRLKELPWLAGHELQNQITFPAAGYIVAALEAARALATEGESLRFIEVQNLHILRPLVFDTDDIEAFVSLTEIEKLPASTIKAKFCYSASLGKEPVDLTLVASGIIEVALGQPSQAVLPKRQDRPSNMIDTDTGRFYSALEELGYAYSGPFRALSSLARKFGRASGMLRRASLDVEDDQTNLLIDPPSLDCAIQSLLLSYSYPHDGQLRQLHVPTSVCSVRLNPALCKPTSEQVDCLLYFDSAITNDSVISGTSGNVQLYSGDSAHAMVQIEGVKLVPLAVATSEDDIPIFSRVEWQQAYPHAEDVSCLEVVDDEEIEFATVLERISTFYLRQFDQQTPIGDPIRANSGPLSSYLNFARYAHNLMRYGNTHEHVKEWLQDTLDDVVTAGACFANTPDVKIMHIIGEQMPRVFRGETTILEYMRSENLLQDYSAQALGLPQTSRWVARVVAQIAHRYPCMNIFEVGAGTGGATKSVLSQIQRSYSSYTFTDVSTGFFENAAITFAEHGSRMIFKAFDAEIDPVAQGFAANSYDLVVASFVMHATSKLQTAMANIRRLLRPGGYVVMAEITDNSSFRTPFIFGTLPGWWKGVDEGRVLSPCVSLESWDSILIDTGFGGIDSITGDGFKAVHPFSVIVAQAIDDQVTFLRAPLRAPAPVLASRKPLEHLALISGEGLRVMRLQREICSILSPFTRHMTVFKTMRDVDHSVITPDTTVLSLVDLQKPVFKDIAEPDFSSLKLLFGGKKTIVWVTKNRLDDDPFSNMSIGFGRTAVREVPELNLHFVDVTNERIEARSLAEAVLRFRMARHWTTREHGHIGLFWSIEPEIIVDAQGKELVPRIEYVPSSNIRYNSARRVITKEVDICRSALNVRWKGSDLNITDDVIDTDATRNIQLRTSHSLCFALKTPIGYGFLIHGSSSDTEQPYIALAESLSSVTRIHTAAAVPYAAFPNLNIEELLNRVAASITASTVVGDMLPGQLLLAHNASPPIAYALSRAALVQGITVIFTTSSNSDGDNDPSALDSSAKLHPLMATADLKALVPEHDQFSFFLDFSSSSDDAQKLTPTILSCLSQHCRHLTIDCLFSSSASTIPSDLASRLGKLLQNGIKASTESPWPGAQATAVTTLGDLATGGKPADALTVIDWLSSPIVPQLIRTRESSLTFKQNKTYWLVGLSGTLGLSLCDWMVEHGAKHVVISSRNPKVDVTWIKTHKAKGANIYIFPNDVTNFDDLKGLHDRIQATLPPLAGVAQGAMVLRDTPIRDMTLSQLTDVLQPKVDGSINLDRVLGDQQLEFVVFFSSVVEISGNIGQANYTAANAFMSSLAAQRRKRGLAASVVKIGVILGVGFVTREMSESQENALRRSGLMWLSERDMRHIFAEGIVASRIHAPDDGEADIICGLREVPMNSPYLPIWHNDPKFGRLVVQELVSEAGDEGRENSNFTSLSFIKKSLTTAKTFEEAESSLGLALAAKLRVVLQMDTQDEKLLQLRTDEIGMDSLIAVEIRAWLMQHFEVNVSILKLLGGISIGSLVTEAARSLPAIYGFNSGNNQTGANIEIELAEVDGNESSSTGQPSSLSMIEADVLTPLREKSDQTSELSGGGSDNAHHTQPSKELDLEQCSSISFTQSLFWVVDSLVNNKSAPNHTVLQRVVGQPRVRELENAVEALGYHHKALRTCFLATSDQDVMQGVLKSSTLHLEHREISEEADVIKEYDTLKNHVYDLRSGCLMRIILLSRGSTDYWLLAGFHHINIDGMSYQVIMRDLDKLCRGEALNPKTLQFPDFCEVQRAEYEKGAWKDDIAYWKSEFATIPEPLPLTRARITTRRPMTRFQSNTRHFRVGEDLAKRIRDVSRANKTTSFHFYLTCFQILLHRFLGVEDLSIGIADSGRNNWEAGMSASSPSIHDSVGPYLNLVPLHFEVTPQVTFGRLIADSRRKSYEGLAHSRVPFDVLLKELQVSRAATAHSPLFQAFVDYRQGSQERQPLAECMLEMMELQMGDTGYDLSLDVIDNPEGDARVSLIGQSTLYSTDDMRAVTDMFEDILEEFVKSPTKKISENWQYRQSEIQMAIELGQGEIREQKWPDTLIEQFEAIVPKYQGRVALIHASGISLTYGQMQRRLDAIAFSLVENGVKPGDSVGIFQESTADWVCSMLAVWKVGAAFVPLDVSNKLERLAMIVSDCQPAVILVDGVTARQEHEVNVTQAACIDVSTLVAIVRPDPNSRSRRFPI